MRFFVIMLLVVFVNLEAKDFSGKWVSGQAGTSLEFISKTVLRYDGERFRYRVNAHNIQIADEYLGYIDYPYKIQNHKLYIRFPEGYTLTFTKVKQKKQSKRHASAGGIQNHLIRGGLCSYSSSYNGGYSHSDRVYFDGVGRYSTGSQTYSSGDSGAYVNEGADGNGGSYKIVGDRIYIETDDGNRFEGSVIEQQSDGRITGIKINGKVFGSALCD